MVAGKGGKWNHGEEETWLHLPIEGVWGMEGSEEGERHDRM